MKLALAITALLFAHVVQAQSLPAYDVTGSASFLLDGETLTVNYSYVLTGPPTSDGTVSDVSFSTSGNFGTWTSFSTAPFDLQWDNSGAVNNGTAPSSGLLFDLDMFPNFPTQVDQSLYDMSSPYGPGPELPSTATFSATAVGVPEPPIYAMLIAGIGMLALRRWKKA